MARDPASFIPLRPVALLILTVLGEGDRHGFAIRKAVLEATRGRVSIGSAWSKAVSRGTGS